MADDDDELTTLIRTALQSGASPAEIAAVVGSTESEVRATVPSSSSATPTPAGEVVRQQIARAERAVAAAEAAGDTAGARVWAGIVARLVPLLVRAEEAQEGESVTLTRADLAAAEAHVRALVETAIGGAK